MTIFGDGEQQRAFTHINDVAPIIARSVEITAACNQVFNVGADVPFTVNHLAEIVAQALGVKCSVKHLPPRNEVMLAFSDHSKARKMFAERAKTSLEAGVQSMAKWVKAQGARESSVFDNIEIMRNLPPSWAGVVKK
jgi:UDP-glucose 4-epimerase